MEEKVIVKSEQYNVATFFKIMLIVGIAISLLIGVVGCVDTMDRYNRYSSTYLEHQEDGDCGYFYDKWETCYACEHYEDGPLVMWLDDETFLISLIPVAFFALVGGLIYLWLRSYEMTVTDKRVYGKVAWGKRVDLPLDSISSTATVSLFRGVAVATSSGRIKFLMVKNSAEIFEKVNALLVERQKKQNEAAPVQPSAPAVSNADELKKFKELLDSGVITQEEFDAKKKELLGL